MHGCLQEELINYASVTHTALEFVFRLVEMDIGTDLFPELD